MNKTNIAVIGCGYWGPNLIRNFNQIPECNMMMCCDKDENQLNRMKGLYPEIETTQNIEDILNNPAIDAVAIATPVYTHKELAIQCLENKKHVLVEKPMASSAEECSQLIEAAERNNVQIMVGHTFEYTAAVNKIKEIVDSGDLGEILYVHCTRVNLGLFQPDINVVWDLAPHDISIILHVLKDFPTGINATGKAHFNPEIEDVASVTLNFANGTIAFLHNSWLDPDKIRKITFVGSKKMLVYDDINMNEKIKIFDKGVDAPPYYDTYAEFQFSYRYGDIHIPKLNEHEPLRRECEHFLESVKTNQTPKSDGYSGLRIVSILEAANRSIKAGGAEQSVQYGFDMMKKFA